MALRPRRSSCRVPILLRTSDQFGLGRSLGCRCGALDRGRRTGASRVRRIAPALRGPGAGSRWARCGWLGPRAGGGRPGGGGRSGGWSVCGLDDLRLGCGCSRRRRCWFDLRLSSQGFLRGFLGNRLLHHRLLWCNNRLTGTVWLHRDRWLCRKCWSWCRDVRFAHGKDGFPCSRFAGSGGSGGASTLQQIADFGGFPVADGAAVALGRNGQLFSGIEHVLVVQAKVLGQLINSDFAAAGHSGLRSVRARCASGHHPGGANGHLASAAVP